MKATVLRTGHDGDETISVAAEHEIRLGSDGLREIEFNGDWHKVLPSGAVMLSRRAQRAIGTHAVRMRVLNQSRDVPRWTLT